MKYLCGFLIAFTLSAGQLPDPQLTPGSTIQISQYEICHSSTRTRRNVSDAMKRRAFRRYGLVRIPGYEVDHLIPLELGGANTIQNLWPESLREGAHQKDDLENRLHEMVCYENFPLAEAQREIATDWISAYNRYVQRKTH